MNKLTLIAAALAAATFLCACDAPATTEPPASKKITNAPGSGQAGTAVERNESGDK